MRTIVAKFGGTSLSDAHQFLKIREIVRNDPGRRFLVVSAPGKRYPEDTKVTDLLLSCFEAARKGRDFHPDLTNVKQRFTEIISSLRSAVLSEPSAGGQENTEEKLQSLLTELDDVWTEMSQRLENTAEAPDNTKAYIVSRGEYLSARILSAFLGFTFVDPEWCVCFDENGKLNIPMSIRTMGASLKPLQNAVIAGFYGADMDGRIFTMSRGGSDVTGSLAAAAVQADLYENWTDVSGLLSADPRIVPSPSSVPYVSYRELRTLSYMGASVLHTDAVLPVSDVNIPINIRNTNKPDDPGTVIVRKLPHGETKYPIIAVAGRMGMSVIQIEKVMVSDESGFTAVILDILKNRKLPFEQCLTGIDTVTLVIRSDLLQACQEDLFKEIRETLHPDFLGLTQQLSMIAVIGEKDTESSDANVQVLRHLTEADIPIFTMNQGAGKLNLLVGVPEERYEEAIRAIYEVIQSSTPAI